MLFKKILDKVRIETRFYLEQKWGWVKPSDRSSIPKYLLQRKLPQKPVIIDCGAHVGADSIELARIFPGSTVYSFEPIPNLFQSLKHNTRKYPNITCHPIALSDVNGTATMNVSSGSSNASSSLLTPTGHKNDHPNVLFDSKVEVVTKTLDRWAEENGVKKVDFLWLDMQGFEMQMLRASSVVMETVSAIHTEVSLKETYAGAPHYHEYKKFLEDLGFSKIIEALPPGTDMGNVLFVRK